MNEILKLHSIYKYIIINPFLYFSYSLKLYFILSKNKMEVYFRVKCAIKNVFQTAETYQTLTTFGNKTPNNLKCNNAILRYKETSFPS